MDARSQLSHGCQRQVQLSYGPSSAQPTAVAVNSFGTKDRPDSPFRAVRKQLLRGSPRAGCWGGTAQWRRMWQGPRSKRAPGGHKVFGREQEKPTVHQNQTPAAAAARPCAASLNGCPRKATQAPGPAETLLPANPHSKNTHIRRNLASAVARCSRVTFCVGRRHLPGQGVANLDRRDPRGRREDRRGPHGCRPAELRLQAPQKTPSPERLSPEPESGRVAVRVGASFGSLVSRHWSPC